MNPKVWLVGGAAVIAVLGGCAGTGPEAGQQGQRPQECSPASPVPVITAGATMWSNPPGMDEVLNEIQTAGNGRFSDVYAGVETVPEAAYVIIYRVPSAEYDELIRRAAGSQCVVIRDARFSFTKLNELAMRINADSEYWRGRGIKINMTGTAHDGSGITVGTLEVEQAQAEIAKHYRTDIPITIVKEAGGRSFETRP